MNQRPSPVLVVRDLPSGISAYDLQSWASQFRFSENPSQTMTCVRAYVSLKRDGCVGYIQMASEDEAARIMSLYAVAPHRVVLQGQAVNLLFSDKRVITATPGGGRPLNPAAPSFACSLMQQMPHVQQDELPERAEPKTHMPILMIVLKGLQCLVSHDDIFWLASQFGKVQKLSYFAKEEHQVLAQFAEQADAAAALSFLNGKEVRLREVSRVGQRDVGVCGSLIIPTLTMPVPRPGCVTTCRLAIVPSRLHELTFQNSDSRNVNYELVNSQLDAFIHSIPPATPACFVHDSFRLAQEGASFEGTRYDFLWGHWVQGAGWLQPADEEGHGGAIQQVRPPTGEYQFAQRLSGLVRGAPDALRLPEHRAGKVVHLAGLISSGAEWPVAGKVTAQTMWRLGWLYGDLLTVKLMYKHPGCVLLEYSNEEDCRQAVKHLKDVRVFGRRWRASCSIHGNAVHWSGTKTELAHGDFMLRRGDAGAEEVPRPRTHLLSPPTEGLYLWGYPESLSLGWIEQRVRGVLARELQTEASADIRAARVGHGERGTACSVMMPSVDAAFITFQALAGRREMTPVGEVTWQVHFLPCTRSPRSDGRRPASDPCTPPQQLTRPQVPAAPHPTMEPYSGTPLTSTFSHTPPTEYHSPPPPL
eukprot:Hpha_TRINITY_DN15918_c1_g1::TRINITY_DN15918_c1_g1_i1::g.72115::m.72115